MSNLLYQKGYKDEAVEMLLTEMKLKP